ncbi:MAG: hypothetical protein ACP6IQ_08960 [Candidatus Njordarchaeia archaeon]
MTIQEFPKARKLRLKISAIDLDNVPTMSSHKKVLQVDSGRYYSTIGTEFYIRNEFHTLFIEGREIPTIINFLFWNINPAFSFRDLRRSYYNGSYAILFLAENLDEITFAKILYYFLESVNSISHKTPYYILVRSSIKFYSDLLSNIFGNRLNIIVSPRFNLELFTKDFAKKIPYIVDKSKVGPAPIKHIEKMPRIINVLLRRKKINQTCLMFLLLTLFNICKYKEVDKQAADVAISYLKKYINEISHEDFHVIANALSMQDDNVILNFLERYPKTRRFLVLNTAVRILRKDSKEIHKILAAAYLVDTNPSYLENFLLYSNSEKTKNIVAWILLQKNSDIAFNYLLESVNTINDIDLLDDIVVDLVKFYGDSRLPEIIQLVRYNPKLTKYFAKGLSYLNPSKWYSVVKNSFEENNFIEILYYVSKAIGRQKFLNLVKRLGDKKILKLFEALSK